MRVTRLVGEAMMLAMIVYPVFHIALHRNEQVYHRYDLSRRLQLAGLMLQYPV
ncbi:MAG: Uncharacterised protein [Hyphomonas sp. TMED17]|nr:MAG: Uncharacterised protein [Hyphomonas sp. TMED17]